MKYIIGLTLILNCCFLIAQNAQNFSCDSAIELQLGDQCSVHSNSESTSTSSSSCDNRLEQDIWYSFNSSATSLYSISASLSEMDSMYNNILTIYSGTCGSLEELACVNDDEYGFLGEIIYLNFDVSQQYYIKVSGLDDEFGRTFGQCCVNIKTANSIPAPKSNNMCNDASTLLLDGEWKTFDNRHATFEGEYLSLLQRNRADVWFTFNPSDDINLMIDVLADFSHTIGLYEGSCDELTLIKNSLSGFNLEAKSLIPNQDYYIQISGKFSSLEGDFDIKLTEIIDDEFDNDDCISSVEYTSSCLAFSTVTSAFSGHYPTCLFHPQNDIWFDYTPDETGNYKLAIDVDFPAVVAVYRNECTDLEEILCSTIAACESAIDIPNLNGNEKYLIQIVTDSEWFTNEGGTGCIEIMPQSDYHFSPLSLEVTSICISDSLARLNIDISNGTGMYTIAGNSHGQELPVGSNYYVQVEDEKGCQQIAHGIISCNQADNECELFFSIETTDYNCINQQGAEATLTVYSEEEYTVFWSNGETGQSITNLEPGEYSIEISNPEEGVCQQSFEITEDTDSYQLFFLDEDEDGYGNPTQFVASCDQIEGYVLNSEDCNDADQEINPETTELTYNGVDDDCNPETLDDDLDQDGYTLAEDCDDNNPDINPASLEIAYNGIDDDCNQETLDDDLDQDGFTLAEDCDDLDASINPNSPELAYNGLDDDCDPTTLDDDLDQDGFTLAEDCDDNNPNVNPQANEMVYNGIDDDCDPTTLDDDLDQDGFVLADDCDDTNPDINPLADETVYNGIDDDCDPMTLDDDLDQDGFVLAEDCDDTNPDINPQADEIVYNGIDDDCDPTTFDDDLDQDGFVLAEDCDDTNPDINPLADETVYNGIDDDCDPMTLDDDLDQDGFVLAEDCDDTNPDINPQADEIVYNGIDDDCDPTTFDDDLDQDGFVLAEDCDDTNPDINPDAVEIANNGIDEDCDGNDLLSSMSELSNIAVHIYPNPATQYLNIEIDGHLNFNVQLFSLNGKRMNISLDMNRIDVSNIQSGVYILQIEDQISGQKICERVVINNH